MTWTVYSNAGPEYEQPPERVARNTAEIRRHAGTKYRVLLDIENVVLVWNYIQEDPDNLIIYLRQPE